MTGNSNPKKKIVCLITGYFNFDLDDGGTVSLATLLGRMRRDGYPTELICLTDRRFAKKRFSSRTRSKNFKVVSKTRDKIICRLRNNPFRLTIYPRDIDIQRANRHKDAAEFEKIIGLWRSILSSKKPDATLTTEDDVFSMTAGLERSPIRLHRISSAKIFEPGRLAYPDLLRTLAPKFRFFCGSGFINRKLLSDYGQKSFDLPPLIDFDRYRPQKAGRANPGFITLINGAPHKGLIIFLSLAKNLPRRKFLVRGRRALIQPYLEKNGISNVIIDDRTEDISSIYRKTRILLVPSLCDDAFARVVTEAMINGIPVIANDVGGIKTALNGAGYLAEVNLKKKDKPDFTTNPHYHFPLIEQYLEFIARLDDPKEYARAVKRSLRAAQRAERIQDSRYREFLKWIRLGCP